MRIKLHQDVEGHKAGETVEVKAERAKWLVAQGYASTSKDADGVRATSVPADDDPTLATNREDAGEGLRERMAAGLGTPGSAEVDDSEISPVPTIPDATKIEMTNGEGDPEKAATGRDALEAAAVKTEVDEEKIADQVQANRAAGDAVEEKIQDEQVDAGLLPSEELDARRDYEASRTQPTSE